MLTMAPPPCSRSRGGGGFGAQEWSGEVDRQYPAPVLLGGLQNRREYRDAGIVDQRIEAAEVSLDLSDGAGDRARIGDIAMQLERIAGRRQCLRRQRLHALR